MLVKQIKRDLTQLTIKRKRKSEEARDRNLVLICKSMEGFQKAIRSAIAKEPSATATATTLPSSSFNTGTSSYSGSRSDPATLLLTRPPRRAVSVLTCSKLCAFCFVAGIVVGFTLKRRVRRWAARLLRRIKDD